jgi:Ig-like domain CHU_C associated/GEVED domain/Bacterial Ig-like domain (group 2)
LIDLLINKEFHMMKIYTTTAKKTKLMAHNPAKRYSKLFLLIGFVLCVLINSVYAQQYVNSNLSTGTLNGAAVVAPAGSTWSELQTGNTTLGVGATAGTNTVVDNFYVCSNWTVTKFTFYGYITGLQGSTTPFNFATLAIFNTDPSTGNPAPIFGDFTTNRYNTSYSANIYRVGNSLSDLDRQLWKIEVSVPSVALIPGNYWVAFSLGNTQAAGTVSYVPLSTYVGTTTQPGNNAKSRTAAGVFSNITDGGSATAQDIPFIIDYITGTCSGTPSPGNTLSTNPGPVCPTVNFTLSQSSPDCQTGITYQWQYYNGSAWVDITGATQSTLTTNFTAANIPTSLSSVQFRAKVTCANGGAVAYSTPIAIGQNSFLNCFTNPGTTNSCFSATSSDDILNVTFGTLNNTSVICASSGNNGYTDYTASVPAATNIFSGIPNAISTKVHNGGGEYAGVWIDYNRNSVFESTEFTALSNRTLNSSSTASLNVWVCNADVNIPFNATAYTTRMRVRSKFGAAVVATDAYNSYTYGETEDYFVNVTPATLCSAVPSLSTIIGSTNTLSSASSVCPNVSFTLSLSQAFGYSGITYQWQSSTDGGATWNNIGTSSATYTATQTVTTIYRCQVICSGGTTNTTTPVTVTMSPATDCYCNSGATSTADEEILNVTISSLNNTSTCGQLATGPGSIAYRYSNYTTSVAAPFVFAGIDNPFSVQVGECNGNSYTNSIAIWIDYNNDGTFDNATERVYTSPSAFGPSTFSGNINIPVGTTPGIKRMRVISDEIGTSTSIPVCGNYTWGETEDYLVNVQPAVSCSSTSITLGSTLSTTSSVCPNVNFNLTLSNTFGYQGITYQWQSSPTGLAGSYTNVPVGGTPSTSGTQSTYTTSLTATTYYQCLIYCNLSLLGNTTPKLVLLAPVTDCYCIPTANCASLDDILNVTIGSINNTSTTASDCVSGGYVNYTSITPAIVFQGTSNPISVTVNAGGQESAGVWIDYDRNGTFDASEFTFIGTGASSTTPMVFSNFINIPITANPGIARMRVRSKYGSALIADVEACTPFTYGQTEDYLVNIQPANSCDNTFNPGNTLSTINPVCPSVQFTLSYSNTSPISGLQWQWQYLVGSTWTDITGATNITFQTTQTVATSYRVGVFCQASAQTTYSQPLLVNMANSATCYCIPPNSTCTTQSITNVNFAGINNPSTCSNNGYINYTGVVAAGIATSGASNPVTISGTGARYTNIWIDYNHNGQFETTEYTSLPYAAATTLSVSGNVIIPPTALPGQTLMRVRVSSGFLSNISTSPCIGITGETEDYQVNIIGCSPVSFESYASDASTTCGGNASFNVQVSSSVTPNELFQWQVKTSPTASWTNIANGAIYSGVTTNILVITGAPLSYNGYSYRVYTNGNCTIADTSLSAKLTVTTTNTTVFGSQPANATIGCAGNASFSFTVTTGPTPTYQWQVRANATSPWINLANGVNGSTTIAGVTTTTLSLTYVTNNFNGYQVRAYVSSPCAPSDTSGFATLTVTPITATLTMTSNPVTDTICNGASITFTASMNFGGTPNATVTGTSSSGTTVSLANTTGLTIGQYVSVISGTGQFAPNTQITAINPNISFTVNQTPTTPISGAGATIGAYQFGFKFYVNNILTQNSASNIFTTNTLIGTSLVRCTVLLNDATGCVPVNPAASPTKTITVTPNTVTSVSIASDLGNSICAGQLVTFTATPTNGGASPTYQWKKNGFDIVGATASTYSTSTLVNGDIISVVMTSNAAANLCSAPNPATSSPLTMTVNPSNPVSVIIAASPGVNICPGTNVTFTATPTNGGTTPAYQWQLSTDGGTTYNNVGSNSTTYSNNALNSNDKIRCILTSSITACTGVSNPATSAVLTMSVTSQPLTATLTPSISGTVCQGTTITYTASSNLNGGTPTYQFYVNGNPVANTTATTYAYTPAANDTITVSVTPDATLYSCASPAIQYAGIRQSVNARPTVSISPLGSTCSPVGLNAVATTGTGATSITYLWQSAATSAGPFTGSLSTASTYYAGVTNWYQVTVTNNLGCVAISSPYQVASLPSGTMSGVYTIGAVAATNASGSTTTITCANTSGLVVGQEVAVTSVSTTGAFAAGTTVTAINPNVSFTVSVAPTTALSGATITQASCINYISFAKAITALNTRSIGGNCVFNVSTDFNEYSTARLDLGAATLNTASSTYTITFQKSGSGAKPMIWSYITGVGTSASATPDGMWALNGIDNVTIDGINLSERTGNTNYMEYGFGLFRLTATADGAQNNTIKNCSITLNKANNSLNGATAPNNTMPNGSTGILVNSATVTTANTVATSGSTTASNSNNKFYTDTIQNCFNGIVLTGFPSTTASTTQSDGDFGNDIGGTNASTGNIIRNFAGSSANESNGIKATAQWNLNVSYNNINNTTGGGTAATGPLFGVNGVSGDRGNVTINNNTINVTNGGSFAVTGISNSIGNTASSNTVSISNNDITGGNASSSGSNCNGIVNGAVCTNLNINGNNIHDMFLSNGVGVAGTGAWMGINNNATNCVNVSISSNTISNNIIYSYATGSTVNGDFIKTLSVVTSATLNNNTISGNTRYASHGTTTTTNCIVLGSGTATATINNNNITNNTVNITAGTTASTTFQLNLINTGANVLTVANNTLNNNGINMNVAGTGTTNIETLYGYTSTGMTNETIYGNTFKNMFISGTQASLALNVIRVLNAGSIASGATKNIYNNTIENIYGLSTYSTKITGIYSSSGSGNIYKNKISNIFPGYNAAATVGAAASGITLGSHANATLNIYNNMIAIDLGASTRPTGAGANVVPSSTTTEALRGIETLTAAVTSSYNLFYNSIRLSGTNSTQFSSSGIYQTNSVTNTSAKLLMRNNIISNDCVPVGAAAGLYTVVADFKRNAAVVAGTSNYDNVNSSNNAYYSGSTLTNRCVYYDGTTQVTGVPLSQTSSTVLATAPAFASATDLHMICGDAGISNAGTPITTPITISDDIDADTRSASTPDIGADEFDATGSFAGRVINDTTVCSGASGTLSLTGYNFGTIAQATAIVTWKSSTDGGVTYTSIPSTAGLLNYTYTNITQTTKFIVSVQSNVCSGTSTLTSDTATVTVNPKPTISGTTSFCQNGTQQFTANPNTVSLVNPWISTNTTVASISTTGLATGLSAGNTYIKCTLSTGCFDSIQVTVNAIPAAPTVTSGSICGTGTVSLSATSAGNTLTWWSAPTGGTNLFTGSPFTTPSISANTIYYVQAATSLGCVSGTRTPDTAFVSTVPSITGTASACIGGTTVLNITAGSAGNGTQTPVWGSSNPAVATVDASGAVTGLSAGTTNITYTNTNGCASANFVVTVNAAPTVSLTSGGAAISTAQVCVGSTLSLFGSATAGATPWSTSNGAIATVNASGVVTGVAAGTCNITYTNSNGCSKTIILTVNPKPNVYTVSGTGSYCSSATGVAVGLSNSQAGINYQLVKTVGTPLGNVGSPVAGIGGAISFGLQLAGTYTVTATNPTTGCTVQMTGSAVIDSVSSPTISSPSSIACIGTTIQLTGSAAANAVNPWVSTNNPVATVNNTGSVVAVSAGSTTIIFTNSTGCPSVPYSFTVNPVSVGGSVTSDTSICIGSTLTRTFTLSGNVGNVIRWESSTDNFTTTVTINNTTNSYSLSAAPAQTTKYRAVVQSTGSGCSIAYSNPATVTVNPLPVVTGISMTGGGSFCSGLNGVLVGLTTTVAGNSYQLYNTDSVRNYGLPVSGNGGAQTFGYVSVGGSYTAIAITSSGCRANINTAPTSVTVTPIRLPVVKINQQGTINICSPASQTLTTTLTYGTASSYQWYNYGTAIPGETNATYTINGAGNNLISVQALNTSPACNSLKSHAVVVAINTAPSSVISSPDTAEICTGGSQTINVTSANAYGNAFALNEDFNGDIANLEWSVYNGSTSPVSDWGIYSTPFNNPTGSATFLNFTTPDGGSFVQADADAGGSGSNTFSILYSDTFSLANFTSANLTFEHALRSSTLFDNYVEVDISTDTGHTWTLLRDYWGTTAGSTTSNAQTTANASISLSAYLGQSNLMVRYYYDSDWGYYWIIDNVKVSGTKQFPTTYSWAPPTGLNVTTGAQVIASPAANTSYIVSATSSVGCVAKDTSFVKIKPSPVISLEPRDSSICQGDNAPVLSVVVTTNSTVSYQWYSNTANSNSGGSIMLGQIADTLVPNVTTTGTNYYYVVVEDIQCNTRDTSRAAAVTVSAVTNITTEPVAPAAVCVGGTAPVITVVASGATLTYQWYSNTTNTNTGGTLIASATAASYTAPVTVANTFYYYVIVSGRCGKDTSAAVTVVVNGNTSITTQPVAPAAACAGGTATPLTVVAAGAGTLTYQWYSNTINSNTGGLSLGATAQTSSYTPVITTPVTTYYYVVVTGTCGPISSNAVAVVVNPVTLITTEPTAPAAVCAGGSATALSVVATGTGTLTYQWYSNTSNIYTGATSLGSATAASYTPSVATAGTTYYYVIVTGTCGKDTSAIVSVVVNANASITTQPVAPAAACAGGTATPLTVVAAGAGTLTYQWYSNTINSNTGGVSLGATAQTASYTPVITTTGTTYYYVVVTGTCGPISSNAVAVVVNPVTLITTEPTAPAAVCAGGSATALSVVATGTGTLTYQWYSNTTNVYTGATSLGSATAASYTPSVATAGTTYYYAIVTGTCGKDTSAIVSVVVNGGSTAAVLSGTATIILGNSTNLQVAITGGTSPYTVVYSDGTSNFTVNNYVSGTNISVSPTVTTTYTLVSVTSASGCLGSGNSGTAVVTVNSASTAAVLSAVAPTTICSGATANLQVAITGGISPFTIVYSNGTTNFTVNNYITGATIPVTPTITTTYSLVSVTSTGGYVGTGNTGSPIITVTPLNTVTLSSAPGTNNQTVCQSSAITTITYATTGATNATVSGLPTGVTGTWASNVVTISGTPSVTGTLNYTVTLTGGCGTITATGSITVTPGISGPLTAGTYYIPKRTCSDFNTIADAVSYLNTNGIANTNGNWIFKVDSNYVETLTATLALGSATLNTGINGVSATKHIVFKKNGTGNNPKVNAQTGTSNSFSSANPDGIWSLRGVDYVTIDGIDLQDNNTTANAMEYGYGLFKTSATDGTQNDTIRNCTISLNRNNVVAGGANTFGGSVGIAVINGLATTATTAVTPTALTGSNSNNKFISNTIQNANTGIGISGYAAATAALFADSGNGIGDSTVANSGNRIINFGGGTSAAIPSYGVYLLNQVDAVVAYNEINNHADGTGVDHVSSQYGIETVHATGTTGIGIKANNVTIAGGANSNYYGIDNNIGGGAGSTVNIVLNNVSVKIPSVATTNTVGSITGIKNTNATPVTTININGNIFKGSAITGTGAWTGIQNSGSATGTGVVNMNNNVIDSNNIQSTGTMVCLQNSGTAYQTLNINNNSITRNNKAVLSPTLELNWLNVASSSGAMNVQGNLLDKDTINVSSSNATAVTVNGIRFNSPGTGATFTTKANTVRKLSIQGINGSNSATLRGYASNVAVGSNPNELVFGNKISNLYISPAPVSTGTPLHTLYGIFSGGSTSSGVTYSKSIYANAVDTLYIRNNGDATPLYNSIVTAIGNAASLNNGNNILIYKNKISHIIPFGTGITTIGRGIWLGSITAGATTSKAYIYNNMVNMDLTEAFDGSSNGSLLTTSDGIRGIDLSQTTADSTFLYFNTVRIAGAGNPTSTFGSSAASINTNTAQVVVRLRNNIFVNKSTAGSTGYAVALRKAGTTSLYDTASRNNLFYVDTTGRRYMYYEVATGFNTLSGTWTTPGSRELNSVTQVEPVFVKASDGTDSLHLNVNTNCAMNASGIAITLPTPSTADDIDGATRGTPPDMGADEFDGTGLGIGQWAGVNTNWNDQINWCGLVPASNTDVTIPGSRTNYPSIDNTTLPVPMCRNIAVNTGGVVNVLSGGKMQIYGNTSTAGGNINAKEGTIEFAGTAAQTIGAGTFQNNNVRNITINNAVGVTLGGQLNLLNKLGFAGSSRTFNIGDSLLHMKSSDTLTAFLANITKDANTGSVVSGNTVTGNAVVERYISSRRAWRLLSMPTTHNAQTIKMAWQEGATDSLQNPLPGKGIQITSNRTSWVGDGFDGYSGAGASVKFWNPNLASNQGAYEGIVSTKSVTTPNNSNGKFEVGKAYMTFIRGDRSVRLVSQSPTSTLLREKGGFNLGDIPAVSTNTGINQFISFGNPYACAVDFNKLTKVGVGNSYYLWDPKPGTYGLFATFLTDGTNTSCVNCDASTSFGSGNYNIQSGQGFFVNSTAAAASVTFVENSKVDGSSQTERPVNIQSPSIRTTLLKVQNGNADHFDEVLSIFDTNFSDSVDQGDALKLSNSGENISMLRKGKLLSIETRNELDESDTIFYSLGQMRYANYRLEFKPENITVSGIEAFLEDNYLHTSSPVSLGNNTDIDFTINTDAGSYASDRFRLVFKQLAPVPVTFVDVKAVKVSKDVNVSWKVENEINIASYVVERSSNGIAFTAIDNVLANGTSVYSLMDRQALSGNNFYRIKAIGIAGDIKYSRVVKVTFEMSPAISMYPNPLNNDRIIHLSFKDMAVGNYAVKVMNSLGQSVMVRNINHTVTNAQYEITLDKNLAHGNYSIEIVDAKDQKTVMNFLF